ncbi:MAG: winged helix DNA-binding domain-containing protein [Anditalea sp.]
MKIRDIVNHRLYNQNISHQSFNNPTEVVQWMGCMQAQDYLASLWAIGLRTAPSKSRRETVIEQAIFGRKIVRTWSMRGTLHFVPASDVRWMLGLLTPRVIRSSAGRYRQLELDDTIFMKSRGIIEQALQGGKQLTRHELYAVLNFAGIATAGQRGIHILNHLAQKEVICFGPRRDKQHTFTLLDEWVPMGADLTHEEALATLAERYFNSHGPATVYDFATWAGLMVTDARKGIEQVRANFEHTSIEGQTYWFPEPIKEASSEINPEEVWLLPAFDEILCGYKDRSAILHSANEKSTLLKNGIICAVIVANGKAAGTWKRVLKKDKVICEHHFFLAPSKALNIGFEQKAEEFSAFLGKKAQISFMGGTICGPQ